VEVESHTARGGGLSHTQHEGDGAAARLAAAVMRLFGGGEAPGLVGAGECSDQCCGA